MFCLMENVTEKSEEKTYLFRNSMMTAPKSVPCFYPSDSQHIKIANSEYNRVNIKCTEYFDYVPIYNIPGRYDMDIGNFSQNILLSKRELCFLSVLLC